MIENDAQLRQAEEQMARLNRSLTSLREELLPANPRNFAMYAEGTIEHIRRLQEEIDAYTGAAGRRNEGSQAGCPGGWGDAGCPGE